MRDSTFFFLYALGLAGVIVLGWAMFGLPDTRYQEASVQEVSVILFFIFLTSAIILRKIEQLEQKIEEGLGIKMFECKRCGRRWNEEGYCIEGTFYTLCEKCGGEVLQARGGDNT